MPKEEKKWNSRFIKYMDMIVNHPNYKGLPIKKKEDGSYGWVAPAKSKIGQARIEWCDAKAVELGIEKRAGMYAEAMLAIHPTKQKVCQICGRSMSLYYYYPNANFLKSLNKTFSCEFTECDHISDIWDKLIIRGVKEQKIADFLIKKGDLDLDSLQATKEEIIDAMEFACRKGEKKCLGPGAMSNFPDRYDGFHSYNRCCRATQDSGRSKENLKSYTKDRRAYEYWSDGNIHAANQFMGSSFFDGRSADHIGPISLGFIHDPRYLQPMKTGDNSSKRDRLQVEDIEKIIEIEKQTGICPMSWYSKKIWKFIKQNYAQNKEKVSGVYRDALKQNMANFMYILWYILENCLEQGEEFLVKAFLEPNYSYFDYSYEFNKRGEIVEEKPRHYTERNQNEKERYRRVAIDSVYDYNKKSNRNLTPFLTENENFLLEKICQKINTGIDFLNIKIKVIDLIETVEKRIIFSL